MALTKSDHKSSIFISTLIVFIIPTTVTNNINNIIIIMGMGYEIGPNYLQAYVILLLKIGPMGSSPCKASLGKKKTVLKILSF